MILEYPIEIKQATSFWKRLLGYMFSKEIQPYSGILLSIKNESRLDSAIHMIFMNFDLAVIWLDKNLTVVDLCLAKKWRPFYFPAKPAKYVLETHPCHLKNFQLGDRLMLQSIANYA